jgi:hypothetical protein
MHPELPQPPHPKLKKLRFIKGAWTAGGHNFDDGMCCSHCRRSWASQQKSPTYCRKLPELHSKRKSTRVA